MTHSTAGVTVIVADDDALIRMVMRRALSQRGIQVVEAVDGTTAVDASARHQADLLITDAHMPGLSLLDTLAAIDELDDSPEVLVISGDSRSPLAPGITFLAKPIELELFLDAVDSLLSRRASR
ncbi:response regulator [Glaciihabitans arcticus]|uniref:Response regulator n=1 Tax=Glaciihabitans arcticus TaxID=2668039 RepID=A0A4V2JEW2_9MICO|nr:response regulator [Glaciihabitans arcticus]TBN57139.1 response regulator [Glaciihabitans arcticus]